MGDRLGLAYKIASTLTSLDLDIVFAKVATEKHLALDIFYITNAMGEKLVDDVLPAIEDALRLALNERNNTENSSTKNAKEQDAIKKPL